MDPLPPVWVEIDTGKLKENLSKVRRAIPTDFFAVVKNNAYGHGLVQTSRLFLRLGARGLAVNSLEEARTLRRRGIRGPILIFHPGFPFQGEQVALYDLTQTLCTLPMAEALVRAGKKYKRKIRVHLKIDIGMGRSGIKPEEALAFLRQVSALDRKRRLLWEGIYTHFPTSHNIPQTKRQLDRFLKTVEELDKHGFTFTWVHAANSAAAVLVPESRLDLCRLGNALYGQCAPLPTETAWCLKTYLVLVKELAKGETLGYGSTYRAPAPLQIGTIPLGYGDGLLLDPPGDIQSSLGALGRKLLHKERQLVRIQGQPTHFLGRTSMGMATIRIPPGVSAQIQEPVAIYQRFTSIPPHIPRLFIEGGKVLCAEIAYRIYGVIHKNGHFYTTEPLA